MEELACWMALAHLPRWTWESKNKLAIEVVHKRGLKLSDFFLALQEGSAAGLPLAQKQIDDLRQATAGMAEQADLLGELRQAGVEVIPLNSPLYSRALKDSLKVKRAPTVLYAQGAIGLMSSPAAAVVGARDAGGDALDFAHRTAGKLAREGKAVVSGFARGVDKTALDGALAAGGRSIIVPPQGIMTFQGSMKRCAGEIGRGDLLAVSAFPPGAGWSKGLAMARNQYIYGLSQSIYVAQVNASGGTWEGALQGLARGCKVCVYYPVHDPASPACALLKKGGVPVDRDCAVREDILGEVRSLGQGRLAF
ncbi:MAG: DNA-processing protein DprA [Duodenibacillus sp.]|nr:DNA-processing protein DprA [Duodenibacillus sp.]